MMRALPMEVSPGISEVIVTIGKGEATVTTLRLSPDEAALLACDLAAAARDARKARGHSIEKLHEAR